MRPQKNDGLAVLDQFCQLLAKAETLEEITDIRSRAEAVRVWAKSAAMGLEAQNRAAELKLRAERKAGELLATLRLRGGDRKSSGHDDRLNLADLGISQNQSKRWQREAIVPEADFQNYVRRAGELGEEVTSAALLRLAHRATDTSRSRTERDLSVVSSKEGAESVLRAHWSHVQRAEMAKSDTAELLELIEELNNHHAVICNLLTPVCKGKGGKLLPAQQKAIYYYLNEIGRLLARALPEKRSAGISKCREAGSDVHQA